MPYSRAEIARSTKSSLSLLPLQIAASHDAAERQAKSMAVAFDRQGAMPSVGPLAASPGVQRVASRAADPGALAPASVAVTISQPGKPLASQVRGPLERALGHDFSRVRVHADHQAAASAQAIGARAYTVGNHIAFGIGQFAPQTRHGQRLLAHELTHVIQQSAGNAPPSLVQREMAYADGYARPYKSDEAEIKNAEKGNWSPASIDFKESAANSGGGSGADTFARLLTQIESKGVGSITELGLIGHANATNFGLSGTVKGKDVWFTQPGLINADTIKANLSTIQGKNLPGRFATNAKIILYGCNAGSGKDLMDAISQAFRVCVEGFKNEIDFCFKWKPAKAEKGKSRTIYGRGRASYTPPIDLTNPDPLAGLESAEKDCDKFATDLRTLKPDQKSCVGVAAKPSDKTSELEAPQEAPAPSETISAQEETQTA
ncbi:DUF4157 domain-containing protein [Caldilinea sp.]|jgi:hypothetical protein|uniref:eCIS core domain-containing protein n=1 Tax=Caldilinea sp. TaxID=2293560 RepID=UPI001B03282D|nr:DUF4157 domain-containing protein [Caldilinea sp.]MBO9392135.1 DUF4157 domain-containing protein [Caldilinea sp.]